MLKKIGVFGAALVGVFLVGPRPDYPEYDSKISPAQYNIEHLDSILESNEMQVEHLKPNNESRIIWADSVRKTPYSIVFLHGFSASPVEADPVIIEIANKYGFNLYLPRLSGHGLDDPDSFKDLSPATLINSAKEAIAIGQILGDEVIIMGSSTGCTLGIYLAAENPTAIHSLMLYSPNIDLYTSSAEILTWPWGLQVGRLVAGKYRYLDHLKGEKRQYWTTTYRLEGGQSLKFLIDETMTKEVFEKIDLPVFLGYYYKDEEAMDKIVSIPEMKRFFKQIQTPEKQKRMVAFPNAGHHVMISKFQSKDMESVRQESYSFMEEVLGFEPL